MGQLTHEQYDSLERAITDKRRIAVMRRGTESVSYTHLTLPTILRV